MAIEESFAALIFRRMPGLPSKLLLNLLQVRSEALCDPRARSCSKSPAAGSGLDPAEEPKKALIIQIEEKMQEETVQRSKRRLSMSFLSLTVMCLRRSSVYRRERC